MKKLLSLNLLIALAVVFASCGTNNNVVNNRLISKRKYNKGFHINRKGNMKSSKAEKEEEGIAFQDVKSSKKKKGKYTSNRSSNTSKSVHVEETFAHESAYTAEKENFEPSQIHSEDGVMDEYASDRSAATVVEEVENENHSVSESQSTQTKKNVRSSKSSRASNSGVMTVLLVLLALFIAPLAVGIYEGITNRFWITLILWLIGIGVGFWLLGGTLAWLCGLAAAIYAILIVLGVI
ncbi:MAG: YqaE/Pmp3 family membrane protein [Fluviicola sp.]